MGQMLRGALSQIGAFGRGATALVTASTTMAAVSLYSSVAGDVSSVANGPQCMQATEAEIAAMVGHIDKQGEDWVKVRDTLGPESLMAASFRQEMLRPELPALGPSLHLVNVTGQLQQGSPQLLQQVG